MNPNSAACRFLVPSGHPASYTPMSDVTDASSSSYDDGPAEDGRIREFPVNEQRLYVVNKSGTGEASYLLLTKDARSILSYRVHTETWRATLGVVDFSAVVLGPYIYILGGFHKARAVCLNRVLRYDACEGEWTECANMVQARARFGACTVDGKIFVCGGERSDGKLTASSEVFDPETNTWSKCGMLLAPRAHCACAGYGKELLCAGGLQCDAAHNNLWIYERHRWQELDEDYPHQLPYNLAKCATAAVGNTFFFIGGISSDQPKPRSERENSRGSSSSNSTDNGYSLNNGRMKGSSKFNSHVSSHGPTLKVPGTSKNPEKSHRKTRYRTERRMFSYTTQISAGEKIKHGQQPDIISPWNFKLPPMIHPRHSAGAVAVGNKIHVVGGTSVETGQTVSVSETYDVLKGTWEEDFTLRKCDVSNVCCLLLEVPKIPPSDRRNRYRLRWVMW